MSLSSKDYIAIIKEFVKNNVLVVLTFVLALTIASMIFYIVVSKKCSFKCSLFEINPEVKTDFTSPHIQDSMQIDALKKMADSILEKKLLPNYEDWCIKNNENDNKDSTFLSRRKEIADSIREKIVECCAIRYIRIVKCVEENNKNWAHNTYKIEDILSELQSNYK